MAVLLLRSMSGAMASKAPPRFLGQACHTVNTSTNPPTIPQPSLPDHHREHHRYSNQFINTAPIEEVHSASTELLTSETLKQLKQLISTAQQQHEDISRDLDAARTAKVDWEGKYLSWRDGMLLKKAVHKSV